MKEIFNISNKDWVTCSLMELCEKKNGIQTGPFGSQLHQRDYVDEGTPIITVQHMGESRIVHDDDIPKVTDEDKNRLSKFLLRKGDIVLSRVGSVDRTNLVTDDEDNWLFSGRCIRVRPDKNKIDSKYLSLYLRHPRVKKYLRAFAVGATMPSLNTKIIQKIPITFPKDKQRIKDVCNILFALDEKINLNLRTTGIFEETAKLLFKSWFIDFDPVRAKAEGRSTGLSKDISDLFTDSFVDSELGKIPKGWTIKKVGDLMEFVYGEALTANKRIPGEMPVYGSNGIVGYHNVENSHGPGIIVGRAGNPGTVHWCDSNFFVIDSAFSVKVFDEAKDNFYFYALKQLKLPRLNSGSAIPGLNRNHAYKERITVPDYELLNKFNEYSEVVFKRNASVLTENKYISLKCDR